MKQIMFEDLAEERHYRKHGGIMLDNGDVICGCCGDLFKANECGISWRVLKDFANYWVDLDKEICGDDYFT